MMTSCEVVVHYVFPTVRALIARELIETHGLTQQEAAKRMGLTQPAISQYNKQLRGSRVAAIKKNDEVMSKITEIASLLAKGELDAEHATTRFCEICEEAKKGDFLDSLDADVKYAQCA
ncbi:MAG: helix-turn-helix domain-containing protein [Candidatus Aenigmatarchaeota archaeon]|nr:MAG: helix-turn-helix domain-containing protein [Candidatus Aenigmarchaeota archaeon]